MRIYLIEKINFSMHQDGKGHEPNGSRSPVIAYENKAAALSTSNMLNRSAYRNHFANGIATFLHPSLTCDLESPLLNINLTIWDRLGKANDLVLHDVRIVTKIEFYSVLELELVCSELTESKLFQQIDPKEIIQIDQKKSNRFEDLDI